MDQECLAFLRYTQSIMFEAGTKYVYLFDLLQEHANRNTAAQAFFNVLMLCNKGVVKVAQEEPYGDVQIKL